MGGRLSLNGVWGLTYAEGSPRMHPDHYIGPVLRGRTLLPAKVPAPIQQVLMDAKWIGDPNVGLNSLAARWIEEMFWIYRRTFRVARAAVAVPAWLIFERLELDAAVLLNGQEIGRHWTAHRPACFNVTGRLRPGENLLVVKLSAGFHGVSDRPARNFGSGDIGLLTKRHWLRNPQYQHGWDWSARLVNVGILGEVRLEWHPAARLAQATVFAVLSDDLSRAAVHVRVTVENGKAKPVAGVLRARIAETGERGEARVTLPPGESRHALTLTLDRPRLWWPIGHGQQHLYSVEVDLESAGERQSVVRRTGVRRVEMDQSPHPVEGRYCTLKVNGRPVFCKGGNWSPPDLFYSAVPRARYRQLVRLAVQASFNFLRVWGGGPLADHALCEACDEAGVMLWHDLLFACAKYPADDPAFAEEACREITHAVRELAHHPSLVVWCGNNEVEWGDWSWGYDRSAPSHPHYALFHRDAPRIAAQEDPSKLFWISSPWSPDLKHPNDPTLGDQHPWKVSILTPGGADFWEYRRLVDRFANEGGVLGASSPATLRQFLPPGERRLHSPSWEHHDNPFACTDHQPGAPGHAYSTVELWCGRDPLQMDWEDYAFASALLQAEGLCEYIANYRRRMFSSACAVFWSYNDSWPVTHGWTIVDYYLRKKLSYHPVRRAFQPVTVVAAEEGERMTIFGINDTRNPFMGTLRWGVFGLAGGRPIDETMQVTLPANSSTPLAALRRSVWKKLGLRRTGAFALLVQDGRVIAQHRLFLERFKDLAFARPQVRLSLRNGILTLRSDVFVWGVCLDVDGERPVADNCFDLLPGVPYRLAWPDKLGRPKIVRMGSRDAVRPRRK